MTEVLMPQPSYVHGASHPEEWGCTDHAGRGIENGRGGARNCMGENEAYLDRQSGKIYWHSEVGDNDEELPDDIDDEKYISIPDKRELTSLRKSCCKRWGYPGAP